MSRPAIKRASKFKQPTLFELPLREFEFSSNGAARTHYGAAVEEIVCHLLKLKPIDTDARFKYCFDAERDGVFFEIKSVRKSGGKCIVFVKRLENDENAGVPLQYVFAEHSVTGAKSNRELWERMSETLTVFRIVPGNLVREICSGLKPKKHYTRPDHGCMQYRYQKGYYTFPPRIFDKYLSVVTEVKGEIYGFPFRVSVKKLISENGS